MNRPLDFSRDGLPITPVVKWLVIVNVAIWFFGQVLLEGWVLKSDILTGNLSLVPERVLFGGAVWQIFTYMFLHTGTQVTHIIFNMLMLWFFGAELEQRWGGRFFLWYYIVCGAGAGFIYVFGTALAALWGLSPIALMVPVLGASGAIFGLLLAYGMLFGERMIYFMMVFPMKAKFFVLIMGFVELASLITSRERGSEVAYLAHLGGIASGFLFLKGWGLWQRYHWNRKLQQKHKGRNLRLVVDNDKKDNSKDPRYWN